MMNELNVARLFDIGGHVAVVTGGLRGIGLMIATTLLQNNVQVFAVSRRALQEDADATTSELKLPASQFVAIQADVTDELGIAALLAALKARGVRRVNVLVNNSGAVWAEPFERFSKNAWDKVIGVNLEAVFNVTRALLPLLEASGAGSVINIGSIDGVDVRRVPHYSYSASKAAVHMLTRTLASHFAHDKRPVTVNAIACGLFATKMTRGMIDSMGGLEAFEQAIPLRRGGGAIDIGGAVVWLASPSARWITGAVIPVDGGQLVSAKM